MDLSPPSEIALRLISLNSRESRGHYRLVHDGEDLLIETVLRFGRQLNRIRRLHSLEAPLYSTKVPIIDWTARLVCDPGCRVFVSSGISTVIHLAHDYLKDFGFTFNNGFGLQSLIAQEFWDNALANRDVAKVSKELQRFFCLPGTSNLTQGRIMELASIGSELTKDAEHVPFGSLAHAIGRKLDRSITLWAFDQLNSGLDSQSQSAESGARAIRYHRNAPEGLEEIILYAPSNGIPSSLDFVTRYAVAHELAHVILGHTPRKGPSLPDEEIEAHCLAVIFLRAHGAPMQREIPSEEVLVEILKNTDLPEADREFLISCLFSTNKDQSGKPANSVDAHEDWAAGNQQATVPQNQEDYEDVKSCIYRYDSDQRFRQEVEAAFLK